MELSFKREDILTRLKANREEHIKIVQEAQKGFREKWKEMLQVALDELEDGQDASPHLSLRLPESHVDDFDRAIEMFTMTTDDEIILDEMSFQTYVRNQWKWGQQFLAANSAYSVTASRLM